jgi:hypothetical protein
MHMTEHGMMDDSARREHEQHAAWEKREAARVRAQNAKEKQAMVEAAGKNKRKGRGRTNYMSLPDTDYHRIHRTDYYADQERDETIEGRLYWCIQHLHIRQDVYRSFRYPLRGMSAIDMDHLRNKLYFDEAVNVIEKMGLSQLLTI